MQDKGSALKKIACVPLYLALSLQGHRYMIGRSSGHQGYPYHHIFVKATFLVCDRVQELISVCFETGIS